MHIWLIAENWPPRIGGIERYLTGIASHFPEKSVTVFAPTETADQYTDLPYVIRKKFSWKPLWPAWLPLYLSLKRLALTQKPDVIICGKALFEGRIARLLKIRLGIPYIVCTYGMEIASWSTNQRTRAQLVRVLQEADKVLCINKKTKQELLQLGVEEKNLSLVYPGIDVAELSKQNAPEVVLKKYNISTPYILTVARLVQRKGIDDLLAAYAKLGSEKIPLVIVGDGPEKESLMQRAKTLAISPIFLGSIPDEDLHAIYSKASLFALTPKELPGDYEGFGIVYIEAAFFGLPVVATDTGGVPEAVQDTVTGILAKEGDIDSIHQALQTLLLHPTIAAQYGEAGKVRAVQEFSWKAIIEQLSSLVSQI